MNSKCNFTIVQICAINANSRCYKQYMYRKNNFRPSYIICFSTKTNRYVEKLFLIFMYVYVYIRYYCVVEN